MHPKFAVLLTLLFLFRSFAFAQHDGIAVLKRQNAEGSNTDQAAATSATVAASPTATTDTNELVESARITLDGQIFPPSIQVEGLSSTDLTDFTIHCVNCSVSSNFSLSAGSSNLDFDPPPDVNKMGNSSGFNFGDKWVAATVDSFDATMQLSLNLNASNPHNSFNIPLFTQTKSLHDDGLTLAATLSTALYGWVNTTDNVNFTYGFDFTIPPFSEVLIDVSNPENSTTIGFNETTLIPIPFSASRSDINAAVEIGIRPSIAFTVSFLNPKIVGASIALEVGLDIPRLEFDITSLRNVTSSCAAPEPSTPADQIYDILTLITPSLGYDVFEIFTETVGAFGAKGSAQQPFTQTFTHNLTNDCLYLDPDKKTMSPASITKPKSTITTPKHASLAAATGRQIPVASTFAGIVAVWWLMMLL